MSGVLLDTCALIWLANRDRLAAGAMTQITKAGEHRRLFVTPISAWEVGLLVSRGRLALTLDPAAWFQAALGAGLQLAPMGPDVLIASSFLPGEPPRDPADRIIAATARSLRLILVTRDRLLLDYAEAGHLTAEAC